jgi:hypothetical protein
MTEKDARGVLICAVCLALILSFIVWAAYQ